MNYIKCGDALQIAGENSENKQEETWYAVAKSNVCNERLQVEYLEPHPTNHTWQFDGVQQECPLGAVQHFAAYDEHKGPQYAWHDLGFQMLGPSTFVRHDVPDNADVPIGDPAFDVYSEDDDDAGSLKDFIADESERFTQASPTSDFVRDVHASVRQFEDWQPSNDQERGIKSFIERIESRAAAQDDNKHFARGERVVPYKQPPV